MAGKSVINVRILGDNKGLKGALDDSEGTLGKWAGKVGGILKVGALAAGGAAAAGLTKGMLDALDAQSNDALIAARLGVSPERAAELGDVAGRAYRDAWGDSLADTTGVVTALATSFDGLGDAELERLTGQAIALGEAFEVDVGQGVQTASELVSSGLAGSAGEAFDLLTRGLQEMPQGIRDELFAASQEYGDFFGDLGLTGEQAFSKLTEYADDGVYGIDKFGDALKELTIRGTDMSAASVAAYDAAGLSAEEMSARFLAGGDVARGALEDTAAGLLSIEDPVERANAAIALFGTPLEDLSVTEIPGFLEGLTDMTSGLEGVDGAAADMADALGGTTSSKIEAFKRKALGALADFVAEYVLPKFEQVVAWFEDHWPEIQETAREVWDAYRRYWDSVVAPTFDALMTAVRSIVDWVRDNWPQISATVQSVLQAVGAAIDWVRVNVIPPLLTAIQGVVAWVQQHWPQIKQIATDVFAGVQQIIEHAVTVITFIWDNFGTHIVSYITTAFETIKAIIEAALTIVQGIIQTVTALISGDWSAAWEGIKTALSGVWEGIVAIVTGFVEQVQTIISAALTAVGLAWSAAWEGIKSAASGAWEGIKTLISGGVDAVVGFVTGIPGRLAATVSTMWQPIADQFSAIKDLISGYVDNIVGFVTGIPGRLAAGIGNGFGVLWDNFKGVLNTMIDAINGIKFGPFTIGGWDLPGPLPDVPSWTSPVIDPIPHIDRFHTGGMVDGSRGQEVPAILEAGEFVVRRSIVESGGMVDFGGRRSGTTIGLQVNGDVKLDGLGVDAAAQRINFALAGAA